MQSSRRPAPTQNALDADLERDRQLAERVLAGDESAFSQVYDAYYRRVRAFIRKRVDDPAEADDLTQETFVQVYRSLGSFQGRSSLRSWVFGIAHNVCLRFQRHCSRWMVGPRDARELRDTPVDPEIERIVDAARILDKCDEALSANRRPAHLEIFQLRYGESCSVKSIASKLGKSNEAVKMSLRKSREVLTDRVPELSVVLEGVARSLPKFVRTGSELVHGAESRDHQVASNHA